jgi:hypothetical protein
MREVKYRDGTFVAEHVDGQPVRLRYPSVEIYDDAVRVKLSGGSGVLDAEQAVWLARQLVQFARGAL